MELGVLPQGEPGVFRSLFLPTLSDLSDEAKQALTAAIQHLVKQYQAMMEEIHRKMEVA